MAELSERDRQKLRTGKNTKIRWVYYQFCFLFHLEIHRNRETEL